MRVLSLVSAGLVLFSTIPALPASEAEPDTLTLNFAVMREGQQIGTSTTRLRHEGAQTIAEIATHIAVKIAHVTVYRFDQTATEHWVDGYLVAMTAQTNDNGTVHKVSAKSRGDTLAVEADGKLSEADPSLVPISLWNAALVDRKTAINPLDGAVTPLSVVDRGKEQLVVHGQPTTAHRYSIATTFPQDVWYDRQRRLVKVEFRGSDGSRIWYQRG
ncbi:MAG TPA: DUF6134 family protein [Stellaceae bacterium]|nr:DUF6134 family protein [Stellaceae bacterium]